MGKQPMRLEVDDQIAISAKLLDIMHEPYGFSSYLIAIIKIIG